MFMNEQDALEVMRRDLGQERVVAGFNTEVTADAVGKFALGYGDRPEPWLIANVVPPTFLFTFVSMTNPGTSESPRLEGWHGFWYRDSWSRTRHVHIGEVVQPSQRVAEVALVSGPDGTPRIDRTLETTFSIDGDQVAVYRQTNRHLPASTSSARARTGTRTIPYRWAAEELQEIAERYRQTSIQRVDRAERLRAGHRSRELQKGPMTITEQVAWLTGAGAPFIAASMNAWLSFSTDEQRIRSSETGLPDMADAIHWDNAVARNAGMPAGYDRGPQRAAWLAHVLTDWLGPEVLIRSLDVRIRAPNYMGDLTRVSGVVREVLAESVVAVDLAANNQLGELTASADATVELLQ
jgi:hypothetical protein